MTVAHGNPKRFNQRLVELRQFTFNSVGASYFASSVRVLALTRSISASVCSCRSQGQGLTFRMSSGEACRRIFDGVVHLSKTLNQKCPVASPARAAIPASETSMPSKKYAFIGSWLLGRRSDGNR